MSRPHIVVIGVGAIGERHLRCFGQTGRADLSICDVNETLRHDIANRYAIRQVFSTCDEVVKSSPHAAVICTPANCHIPMATKLAEAGVHLLVEKPLSVSTEGVEPLMNVVASQKLSVAIAYVLRMNPLLAEVRRIIFDKRFGQVVQVSTVSGQHFPTYRPAYRNTYYTDHATGGGAIQDALTHQVNAVEWLVGPVTRVAADASHQVLKGVDVEDTVHMIARHGQVQSSFSLNQHQAPNETTMTIVCKHGTIQVEFHRQRWRWQTEPDQGWQLGSQFNLERDDMFVEQARRFLDAVERRSSVACTLTEGLQTLKVNLAVLRAAETQTWQDIR